MDLKKLQDQHERLTDLLLHSLPYIVEAVDDAGKDEFPAMFLKDVLTMLREVGVDEADIKILAGEGV